MSVEMITIISKLTQKEYVEVLRQHMAAAMKIRTRDIIILTVGLSIFGHASLTRTGVARVVYLTAVLIILVILAYFCYLYFCVPIIQSKKYAKHLEETTLIFSNNGIELESKSGNGQWKWSIFSEMNELPDFYTFSFPASEEPFVIPKRVFINREQMRAFERMALSNIKTERT